jgi:hypothetical protein
MAQADYDESFGAEPDRRRDRRIEAQPTVAEKGAANSARREHERQRRRGEHVVVRDVLDLGVAARVPRRAKRRIGRELCEHGRATAADVESGDDERPR